MQDVLFVRSPSTTHVVVSERPFIVLLPIGILGLLLIEAAGCGPPRWSVR